MGLLVTNNVKKIIAAPIAASDTTITLADTIGLPNVSAPGDYTMLTLIRLSDLQQEIVQVDDIVGNVLTVQRAQEGTIALSFIGNDQARNFFTAGMFEEIQQGSSPPPPASETVAGVAELATQTEADAGTDDERIITPLKLKNVVDAVVVTPDASETVKGKAELATQIETDGGTDDTRIVTPLKLATHLTSVILPVFSQVSIFEDQKPDGVDGGTFTSGAWRTRTLNTTSINNIPGASLGANQVTLPEGTYSITITAAALDVQAHVCRLRNVTDATDAIIGVSSNTTGSSGVSTNAVASGSVTIASSKVFEVQHQCGSTKNTNGFGEAANFGVNEVYCQLVINKIG